MIKYFAAILFIVILSVQYASSAQDKPIKVVLRYDDYSSLSSTDLEVRLFDFFEKHEIPCTIGVIPFAVSDHVNRSQQNTVPLSETKSSLLLDGIKAGAFEIAQHGYSHQTNSNNSLYSEFYGIDYDRQFQKIEKGKVYLESIFNRKITTFIPPFNSYDLTTLRVLERLGISCISSSLEGDARENSNVAFLPKTSNVKQLRHAVVKARDSGGPRPIIVALFHEYDFTEIDRRRGIFTFNEFIDTLEWLISQNDVHIMNISQAHHAVDDLSAHRFLMNRAAKDSLHFMPQWLRNSGLNNSGMYHSSRDSLTIRGRNRIVIVLFYLSLIVVSFFTSRYFASLILSDLGYIAAALRYGLSSLLILFALYAFHDLDIGYKGVMAIAMLAGSCVGIWSAFYSRRRSLERPAKTF